MVILNKGEDMKAIEVGVTIFLGVISVFTCILGVL